MDSAPSRELILAQIASNRAVEAKLKKFKSGIEISDSNRSVFESLTEGQINRILTAIANGQNIEGVTVTDRLQAELRAWQVEQSLGQNEAFKKARQPKNTKQYKIRILGQHDESIPPDNLPWAWPPFTHGPNPMWNTGSPFYPVGTWVYVYKDPISNQYFIDRVSANSVCEIDPTKHGFQPGDGQFLLVPDTMYRKQHGGADGKTIPAGIPDCASVSDYQVYAETDDKQFNIKDNSITFSTYCRTKGATDAGSQISGSIKQGKKISERLDEQFKFLENFKTGIDDAVEDWEGYRNVGIGNGDARSFWQSLRTNDVTLQSFANTINTYRINVGKIAKNVSAWIVNLLTKLKNKAIVDTTRIANALIGLFPPSSRFITSEAISEMVRILSCVWNLLIRLLPGFVDRALSAFFKKIVNTVNCLIEDFLGGFLGQLLGQVAALINGVFNNIINALQKVQGVAGAALDLIDAIGNTLDNLLKLLRCEFECSVNENNVINYDILDGAKPDNPIDFGEVLKKAKKVGEKWEAVTKIPEDIENYNWEFDVTDLLEEMFDDSFCDSGPVFCGVPSVTFWGVNEAATAVGNAVVNTAGELIGVDLIDSGEYSNAPLIDIDDKCGNGNGGTGRVFIGPVTGIGTVGVATTGGLDGSVGDLDDDGTTGGQFGQGTTAGIGITYHVTVNAVAVGNRFFIDDKQQKTLTFERGNTYILNQEHVSNNGHPLRFSETKDGAWVSGGKEYTRGVTIDGIPGLGKSATDTAYSRIVVDNNTPERLYYYCQNHKKMGGVINVITPEKIISTDGRNATVEIAAVNTSGGAIALKNLKGGSGYNECMANVPTQGGSGTGLTLEIVKTNGGSIEALSINNKGSNYQIGDIVTITSRLAQIITRPTKVGVTKVLITNSGYGYLPVPDGSMGGMNRTWANRCQTIVRRKNLDWDNPYTEGDVINLYTGDWVQLPGKPKVYIDNDFDASKLPGAQVTGVIRYVPQDMTDFPISSKRGKKSIDLGISSTSTLIPTFAPDGLYDWQGNGPTGVARTDGLSPDVTSQIADWNFYLNGEYLGEFKQNSLSEIPQIEQSVNEFEKIVYRVGIAKSFTPADPFDDQIPWVRTADVLPPTAWVLTSYDGWSPFLKNYGVYPSVNDPQYSIIGTMSATWRVATFVPGSYTFEMQADNVGTIYMDGVKLGSTQPYAGHNRFTVFNFQTANLEPQIHEIKVEIENLIHREVSKQEETRTNFNINPAAVAWVLKDPYGAIVKTSLDEYGVPNFTDIVYGYDSYYSIKAYNARVIDGKIDGEWFDCETDYKSARLLGFTDCDIRHFLENNPDIKLDACMRGKLDDDNWGKCDGDLMVSITAPGCPPTPCLPNNTYPVIISLDEIYIENTGFGFDPCKDTVVIEPANGAKAKIEESENGEIKRIVVTDGGAGFTSLPTISINTETGFNAILKPIMKFSKPEEIDAPDGTNVIQVIDCVGKVG